jgi:branched-chain amino acid transport system permease protein
MGIDFEMNISKSGMRTAFALAAIVVFLLAVPLFISSPYMLHVGILLFIYMILATSWNLLGGFTGQLNLGHAAFFGVGAYVSALFYVAGVSPLIGIVMGGVTGSVFAALASPTFRLRGVYFAIGTLALSEAMRAIVTTIGALGGASGLRLRALEGYEKPQFYYIGLVILLVSLVTTYWVIHSKTGMAFKALCGSEDAAESLGISPFVYKVWSFVISAFWAGITGGFYAAYILFVEPNNAFNIFWTFNPVFAVLIGGIGTFFGPIVGSVLFVLISELTIGFGKMSSLLVGVLLIAVIILAPKGIMGFVRGRLRG